MWWIWSCPQNLAWIDAGGSEKPEFADDGRMDDERLRHDSSSADKVKSC